MRKVGKLVNDLWVELAKVEKDPEYKQMLVRTQQVRTHVNKQLHVLSEMGMDFSDVFGEFIGVILDVQEINYDKAKKK